MKYLLVFLFLFLSSCGSYNIIKPKYYQNYLKVRFVIEERTKPNGDVILATDADIINQQIQNFHDVYCKNNVTLFNVEPIEVVNELDSNTDWSEYYQSMTESDPNVLTIYFLFIRIDNILSDKMLIGYTGINSNCIFIFGLGGIPIANPYVFSHEMGHYGGLIHSFQEQTEDSYPSVNDIPNYQTFLSNVEIPNVMSYSEQPIETLSDDQLHRWMVYMMKNNFNKFISIPVY